MKLLGNSISVEGTGEGTLDKSLVSFLNLALSSTFKHGLHFFPFEEFCSRRSPLSLCGTERIQGVAVVHGPLTPPVPV